MVRGSANSEAIFNTIREDKVVFNVIDSKEVIKACTIDNKIIDIEAK
jgi:hypothetical protein